VSIEGISPSDRDILIQLKAGVGDYMLDSSTTDIDLRNKKFVSVSGPAGAGKTTIGDEVVKLEPSIRLGNTTTNRPRKRSDPAGFRTADEGVTLEGLAKDIDEHRVLNYDVIVETGTVYAFYPDGLQGEHNIGPLTAGNVNTFFNLGLGEYEPVYVIAPVPMWSRFIRKSVGERPDLIANRVEENIESLEFARDNIEVFRFVESRDEPDGIKRAAEAVIAIALHRSYPVVTYEFASQSLDAMIAYTKQQALQ
jgi:hypothetical protein